MTRKEKLYRDYIIEYNKVCELTGEALLDCSEEFFNSAVFRHEASVHTLLYWLDAIEYQKVRYSEELKRIRVEEYLNTDEGKELLKRRDELIDARAMFFKETEGLIDRNIKRWLGEQWGIWLYNNSICIGLVKEVDKDGLNKFHFGHTFDVLFSKSYKEAELKSFDLNYGTMGKFSLLEVNSLRSQLLFINTFSLFSNVVISTNCFLNSFLRSFNNFFVLLQEDEFPIATISGICLSENIASRKVMEKSGFVLDFEGEGDYQGEKKNICKYHFTLG